MKSLSLVAMVIAAVGFMAGCCETCSCVSYAPMMTLDGTWQVSGLLPTPDASHPISLPGTLGDAQLGPAAEAAIYGALTPKHQYIGKAVYTRTVTVPETWRGDYELFLERVMWKSEAKWDDTVIGTCDSLAAPHTYIIPEALMTPGEHTITLTIDNSMVYPVGEKSHSYGDSMQTRWNGVIGKMELRPVNPLRKARVFAPYGDTVTVELPKEITAKALPPLDANYTVALLSSEPGKLVFRIPNAEPWSEFNPKLYTITLADEACKQTHTIRFGFRSFEVKGNKAFLNGTPLFLRGNTENCHFPLTGYPAMDKATWLKIFGRLKAEGVNQIRCHTWAVPQAAYDAADELGLLVSPEVIWIDGWMVSQFPYLKGLGQGYPELDAFVKRELFRILDAYGNATSFFSMSVGNELGSSDFNLLGDWMAECKAYDNRHLYAASSARQISKADDFFVSHQFPGVGMIREWRREGTDWDYESVYSRTHLPTVAHEIGQWPVWPDFEVELPKYTGILRAWNLEGIRDSAEKAGVLKFNKAFAAATVKTNRLMYKDEIESFFRTPSCAGLQLLGIQDYSGQGEALIGWWDSFYDVKPGTEGLVPVPNYFAPVAHLARFAKYTWTTEETLTVQLVVHNYAQEAVTEPIAWSFADQKGEVTPAVNPGEVKTVATLELPLKDVAAPGKHTLTFGNNAWSLWVYPAAIDTATPENVLYTESAKEAQAALAQGKRVLLNAYNVVHPNRTIATSFIPVYWSRTWFPGQRTWSLGMMIQEAHPAFAHFPTDNWQDWQWKHIINNSATITFDNPPADFLPMAMPIIDFHKPTFTGLIFETKVGEGKLLVCGVDLENTRPEIQQLRASLLAYAASEAFNPTVDLGADFFETTFLERIIVHAPRPEAYAKAVAYIEAASNVRRLYEDTPWTKRVDRAELTSGTYTITGDSFRTWVDGDGAYWVDNQALEIVFKGATNIRGKLLVRFRDPNNVGRTATGSFDGGRTFDIPLHTKSATNPDGSYWLVLPVDMEDFLDGELRLSIRKTGGSNIMVDRLILLPNEE